MWEQLGVSVWPVALPVTLPVLDWLIDWWILEHMFSILRTGCPLSPAESTGETETDCFMRAKHFSITPCIEFFWKITEWNKSNSMWVCTSKSDTYSIMGKWRRENKMFWLKLEPCTMWSSTLAAGVNGRFHSLHPKCYSAKFPINYYISFSLSHIVKLMLSAWNHTGTFEIGVCSVILSSYSSVPKTLDSFNIWKSI